MKILVSFFAIVLFFNAYSVNAENTRYPIKLAPSAELRYAVKASRSGFPLNGQATVNWQVRGISSNQTYSITTETRADLLGKVLEANSFGKIDAYGLAPDKYEEKGWRKNRFQTTFDRSTHLISFSEAPETVPLIDGEQDRTSAVWQLVSIARGSPKKFIPKSKWSFSVAGRKNAEQWTFTVDKNVTLSTAFGKISTVHITKSTSDAKDQRVEIWLAPTKEWYPVRIKSVDPDGDMVEQNLVKIQQREATNE